MLTHSAIAVFAAAFGCVATLFAVVKFDTPPEAETVNIQPTVSVDSVALTAGLKFDEELQQLQSANLSAEAERSQMSKTLVLLTRDLEDVQAQLSVLEQANTERLALSLNNASEQSSVIPNHSGLAATGFNRRSQRQTGQERVKSLVAAGIDERTALDLQARRDQQQLARLELLDQAAREGWSDSEQLQERLTELNLDRVDLRVELGDDAYDRFLYESGDVNRVSIDTIITGSAADIAGLDEGDSILSYDNQRIFRVRELQQATRGGVKGEYVQIMFDRGGQYLSADLPRGPLGVTLRTSSVEP